MRQLLVILFGLLVACATPKAPAPTPDPGEGANYQTLETPVPTADPARIEVVLFFFVRCSHCLDLEPEYLIWQARQADDVDVSRVHIRMDDQTAFEARAYYTAVTLGVADKVLPAMYEAIHADRKFFTREEDWAALFGAQGIPEAAFKEAFNSRAVADALRKGEERRESLSVYAVPEIIVGGRYRVSPRLGHREMMQTVDLLIARIRAERSRRG